MRSQRWNDLSPRGKILASIAGVIGIVIVAGAERDIQRRDPSEIRGGKLPWRLVSLNALGALVYFRWGRTTARP